MSRKQFLVLLIVLIVLGAAGAWLMWSDRSSWQKVDARIGQKLFPNLKLIEVAEVAMQDGLAEVHLVKSGATWIVKERADFPVDMNRLSNLLNQAGGLKIVQAEKIAAAERAGYVLVDPQAKDGKSSAQVTGTLLDLKNASGKSLARMVLGKIITKRVTEAPSPGEPPKEFDKPIGRHLIAAGDEEFMVVVSDALAQADASPAAWLNKEVLHIDRTKSVTVTNADGSPRYKVWRKEEGDWWNFGEAGPRPDQQKAQDSVSPLYAVSAIDVVANPSAAKTGLDKPVVATVETFDNLTYTIKIGAPVASAKPGEKPSYHASFSIAGDPPKERTPEKSEKADVREKKAKEYAEYRVKLLEQIAREKQNSKWTYLLPAYPMEPLLRARAEMLPEKKSAAAAKK